MTVNNGLKAIALILCSAFTLAQTTPAKSTTAKPAQPATKASGASSQPAAKPAETPAKPAASVPADAAIITIPGLCAASAPAANCDTKISRAEFEKILSTLGSNVPPEARRQVAGAYVQLLTMATEGQKLGVDKDPAFQEQLKLEQLKLFAKGAEKKLEESSKPTEQELENFYSENSGKFEELTLHRIMIPKTTDKDAKPEQLKAEAEKIRGRAAAGEDPDKLEAEAFKLTKAPGAPPSTNLGTKRRGSMDPRHEQQIVGLHAGEVSPLLEDIQSFYIYKLDAKRLIPLQSVQKEVESALQGQKIQAKLKQLFESAKPVLNDAYFGPEETAPKPPAVPPQATPHK